jgi:hypothetical protein
MEEVKVQVLSEDEKTDEKIELEDDENIKALKFIWQNIEAAQSRTGAFSMSDCEQVLNSYTLLLSFLKALNVHTHSKGKEDGEDKAMANQLIFNAYTIILNGIEIQQAKGIYTITGSVEILKQLKHLKASLDAIKDPSLELKELKNQSKIVKDKADKGDKKKKNK